MYFEYLRIFLYHKSVYLFIIICVLCSVILYYLCWTIYIYTYYALFLGCTLYIVHISYSIFFKYTYIHIYIYIYLHIYIYIGLVTKIIAWKRSAQVFPTRHFTLVWATSQDAGGNWKRGIYGYPMPTAP